MIIAVPKGRIFEHFKTHLEKKNIYIKEKKRKLILNTNLKKIKIATVKSNDCFFYVKKEFADIGLLGSDIFFNSRLNKKKYLLSLKTNFFNCKISIIRNSKESFKRNFLNISTKYTNIVKDFVFFKKQKILKIHGSNELCLNLNVTDYIADIVESGETIKKNKLKKVFDIFNVFPIFFFKKKKKKLNKIIKKII